MLAFGQAETRLRRGNRKGRSKPGSSRRERKIGQRSVGANLPTGVPSRLYQASAKRQMNYAGRTLSSLRPLCKLTLIFLEYGTKPNQTDMQQAII